MPSLQYMQANVVLLTLWMRFLYIYIYIYASWIINEAEKIKKKKKKKKDKSAEPVGYEPRPLGYDANALTDELRSSSGANYNLIPNHPLPQYAPKGLIKGRVTWKNHIFLKIRFWFFWWQGACFFLEFFCVFKVKNAVKNTCIMLLWMAEMSVVYHRLGWACSLRRDFRCRHSKTWLFSPSSP